MKKTWIFVTLIALIAVLFTTAQVMASPAGAGSPFKPSHTPGTQATAMATQGSPQGNLQGNAQGNSNGQPNGKPVNNIGTIGAVDSTSLTLDLRDGSSVVFAIDTGTRIKIPTMGKTATVADLLTGMKVGVHAVDNAGVLTAKIVLVIPGKPVLMHRVGVVTDYQPGVSITIQTADGSLFTYLLTTTTKLLPAALADQLVVGSRVTIIMPRDVTGGSPTAKGIVIHPAQ